MLSSHNLKPFQYLMLWALYKYASTKVDSAASSWLVYSAFFTEPPLNATKATATRALEALAKAGLVTRVPEPKTGSVGYTLTKQQFKYLRDAEWPKVKSRRTVDGAQELY